MNPPQRTRAPCPPAARGWERGSAVVGFVLVVVPFAVLLLAVLQGIAYLRVHELVAAGAAEGARRAAAADRSSRDGGPVAERVLARTVPAAGVRCTAAEEAGAAGTVYVVVRCAGTVRLPVRATARLLKEGR